MIAQCDPTEGISLANSPYSLSPLGDSRSSMGLTGVGPWLSPRVNGLQLSFQVQHQTIHYLLGLNLHSLRMPKEPGDQQTPSYGPRKIGGIPPLEVNVYARGNSARNIRGVAFSSDSLGRFIT